MAQVKTVKKGKPPQGVVSEDSKAAYERRKLLILVFATIAILIIALLVLLLTGPSNTLASCSSRGFPNLKYSCYEYFANQTKNASICNSIPTPIRYSCISNVAFLSSNQNLCTAPGMPYSYRNSCLSAVGISERNSSICAEINGTNESACAYGVAEALNFSSPGACGYINNGTLMGECYSKYYYGSAIATGEYTYCNSLPNTPNFTVMSSILASNLSEASNAYTYTYYNITPMGICYSKVAYSTDNQSICSGLSGINSQFCKDSFVTPKPLNESSLLASCSSVPLDMYNVCTSGILTDEALKTGNVSICLSLNQTGFRSSCLSELAVKMSNSTYCSYINNATLQQSCLSYFNFSK
jgi:hypothetical protein